MNSECGLSGQNKMVNVHGVRFDISSILNDVTASIQNNIQRSLDGALKDYELYKSTHDAILQLPFVRELYNQNKELISQLEMMELPNSQSQPIQLKIDELSPQSSPVLMHSYFQTDSNDDNDYDNHLMKTTNEKLLSASEDEASSSDEEKEEEDEASSSDEEKEEDDESSSSDEEKEEEDEVSTSEEEKEEEDEVSTSEEEEEAEEEEEEEEAEEEEEEEEEAEEEKEEEEEEEEEEVYEIVIKNVTYFTTNEDSGDIYSSVGGDVGEIVGKFKNKKPVFMKRK